MNCLPVGPALPRADPHGLDAVAPLLDQAGDGSRRPTTTAGQEEGGGRRGGALQPRGGGGGVAPPPVAGLPGPAGEDGRPARLGRAGEAVLVGAAAPAVEALLAVVEVVARLAPGRLFSAVVRFLGNVFGSIGTLSSVGVRIPDWRQVRLVGETRSLRESESLQTHLGQFSRDYWYFELKKSC